MKYYGVLRMLFSERKKGKPVENKKSECGETGVLCVAGGGVTNMESSVTTPQQELLKMKSSRDSIISLLSISLKD